MNYFYKLLSMLDKSPRGLFSDDVKVKINNNFLYPDVMVVCGCQYYSESLSILVKVLSKLKRRADEITKCTAYRSIPKLQEYLLIEQVFSDVEVCRRSEGWLQQHYFFCDQFMLDSIEIGVSEEYTYMRVQNQSVLTHLQKQQGVEDAS